MDATPLVRGTGRSLATTAVRRWGRVASAVGGRRDPRPAVNGRRLWGWAPSVRRLHPAGECARGKTRAFGRLAMPAQGAEPPETPRCLFLALSGGCAIARIAPVAQARIAPGSCLGPSVSACVPSGSACVPAFGVVPRSRVCPAFPRAPSVPRVPQRFGGARSPVYPAFPRAPAFGVVPRLRVCPAFSRDPVFGVCSSVSVVPLSRVPALPCARVPLCPACASVPACARGLSCVPRSRVPRVLACAAGCCGVPRVVRPALVSRVGTRRLVGGFAFTAGGGLEASARSQPRE